MAPGGRGKRDFRACSVLLYQAFCLPICVSRKQNRFSEIVSVEIQ